MPDLLLPPNVVREIQKAKWREQRQEYRAMLSQLFDFDDPVCREWNRLLGEIDPLLRMGRARPQASIADTGFPVYAGFYTWVRDNEHGPPTVTPITGADGESFKEPDSGLLEQLRSSDLQNPKVFAALLARRARAEADEERAVLQERESRQSELMERWAAVSRTQVSMNRDSAWGQNSRGAALMRGAKKRG